VLDDIGAERCTDWARETLATLIEDRYTRELFTVFTSNYSPSRLAVRLGHDDPILGQRIDSRIVESCVQVGLDGPDRRLRSEAA